MWWFEKWYIENNDGYTTKNERIKSVFWKEIQTSALVVHPVHFNDKLKHASWYTEETAFWLKITPKDSNSSGFIIVADKNSYWKPSVYLWWTYTPIHLDETSIGIFGAIATWYQNPQAPMITDKLAGLGWLHLDWTPNWDNKPSLSMSVIPPLKWKDWVMFIWANIPF